MNADVQLKELLAFCIENGDKNWVCPPCFKARGLDENKLIPGASFADGAPVAELLARGAASLSY
ncbi:MAG: DsrE family protein [Anaerolineae bacterium]|jgi:predicted peroxiredoxin